MLAKLAYWAAVVVVSLALLVALILFFESRDDSVLGARILLPYALSPASVIDV